MTSTASFLASIPVLLAGVALSLAMRGNKLRAAAAIITQAVAILLVVPNLVPTLVGRGALEVIWPWSSPVDVIRFRVDALSAFFLFWSLPMTLLGTIYAVGYLRPYFDKGRNGGPHFALLNLVSLSFVLIYSVQNTLVFLFGWEIAAVSAWLLVIWDYRNQKIRFAGFNYLVSTHVGLFVLVAAFMLLHSKTGSMDFAAYATFLSRPSPSRGTIFLLLGVSFALKSAFFPFHTWLPRAHAAAPAHVSALMSGVIHKAGLFGFLRFTLFMGRPEPWMGWTVLAFGALSAFFGVLYTATQRDLKRLLGYSSTENVGIAAMGFGVGYLGWTWGEPTLMVCGFGGGLLHILNHAVFKCLLFYAAGAVYRAAHSVVLERLGGLARRLPLTAALFLLGAFSISALPPLNGFISEFILYSGFLSGRAPSGQANAVLLCAAALLGFVGAVSAFSMTRAFGLAFLGVPREPTRRVGGDPPPSMLGPMVAHAALALAIGLFPVVGIGLGRAVLALFPIPVSDPPDLLQVVAPVQWAGRALLLLLLGGGYFGWRQAKRARTSVTWGCGYTAPSPRMQYTGGSFSEQFARIFASLLPAVVRERLPKDFFPEQSGHYATHPADAVERRMFEVLGQSTDMIEKASVRIPEQPRVAFAAGLVAVVIIGVIVFGVVGR